MPAGAAEALTLQPRAARSAATWLKWQVCVRFDAAPGENRVQSLVCAVPRSLPFLPWHLPPLLSSSAALGRPSHNNIDNTPSRSAVAKKRSGWRPSSSAKELLCGRACGDAAGEASCTSEEQREQFGYDQPPPRQAAALPVHSVLRPSTSRTGSTPCHVSFQN